MDDIYKREAKKIPLKEREFLQNIIGSETPKGSDIDRMVTEGVLD